MKAFGPLIFAFVFQFFFLSFFSSNASALPISQSKFASPRISPSALKELVKKAEETDSDALIVYQKGQVILEKYFRPVPEPQTTMSVTKSVVSLLIGILLEEGKIPSLDTPASHWFSNWKEDPEKSKITLKMLLNHTSGVVDDEQTWQLADRTPYILEKPLGFSPGQQFQYSSAATYLLASVIEKSSGQPADIFANERIFKPMGITNWKWKKDGAGTVHTGGGLFLLPSDMLKIGILMLEKGRWNRQQIVPRKWIHQSLLSSQNHMPNCGLLWWLVGASQGAYKGYTASGYGGQYITVYPELNLVAVRQRHLDEKPTEEQFQLQSWGEFPEVFSQF